MKKAIDKSLGVFLGIIAIIAGFSVAAELVRPYMGWIVIGALVLLVAVVMLFLWPVTAKWIEDFKNRNDDPWEGSGS